jgi:hypothetical protein
MAVNNIRIQKLHTYNKFFVVMPDRKRQSREISRGGMTYERETDRQSGRTADDQEFMTEDIKADRHEGKTTDTQIDTLADSQTNSLSM